MPFEPDAADDGDLVDPTRRVVVRRRAGGMASLITACTAEEAVRGEGAARGDGIRLPARIRTAGL